MGIINPHEDKEHISKMDRAIEELKRSTEEEEICKIMKDLIENVKMACMEVYAQITDADILRVLHSMVDPYGLALWQQTEEIERMMEVIMPEEELPKGNEMVCMVGNVRSITMEIKAMKISLMDHTTEAYYQTGLGAERFSALAKICTPDQLRVILCYAAWPIIQLERVHGFSQAQSTLRKKKDLPDDCTERVNLPLLPNPKAKSLKRELRSSSTRLLVGVVY